MNRLNVSIWFVSEEDAGDRDADREEEVSEDEDTNVRGTVSLNSISLGLKKVNIE